MDSLMRDLPCERSRVRRDLGRSVYAKQNIPGARGHTEGAGDYVDATSQKSTAIPKLVQSSSSGPRDVEYGRGLS